MLGRCAQDTCIPREIALRESGHHAAAAGTSDAQTNGIPDREDLPDPGIFREVLLAVRGFHHDIWAKPPNLEAPRWIQFPQPIECSRGQQMNDGTVEKRSFRQTEVGDGVPVLERVLLLPLRQLCRQGFTEYFSRSILAGDR